MKRLAAVLLLALSGIPPGIAAGPDGLDAELPGGILSVPVTPAPALELPDADGELFNLESLRGQWVLVHFWASWCGPCRREMPTFQVLSERLGDTPLQLVLVNTAETDEDVFNFLTFVAPDLDTLMDYDGSVTERWQPRGLPASFLVDPKGGIRYLALGGRPWDRDEYVDFLRGLAGGSEPVE